MKLRRFVPWIVAALFAGAAVAAVAHDAKKASRVALPAVHIAKGDKCVEPTDVMRKNHMKFILHQRDETMHKGIRTTKHSLKECIDCHADPKTNSVLGENGFCASCHAYAAVSIDCFSCHNAKRETTATRPAPARSANGAHLRDAISAVEGADRTTGAVQ